MSKTRKRYGAEFKAKVAVEAVKEQKTLSELAIKFQLHPNQISQWKKQLLDNASNIFLLKANNSEKAQQQLEARLYQQIGQLTVELDWLKKKLSS
jgi:transposase-like protein